MKNKLIIFLLALLLVNIYFWPEKPDVVSIDEESTITKSFNITLTGEVVYPGIYTFYRSISLKEVLNYAGGITNKADSTLINFNEVLNKDKTIDIKALNKDETELIISVYDLNTISKKDLLDLVGVIKGLTLNRAINIILYRQQEGLFLSVEDLLKVKEIGPKTYEQIKDYFKV